MKRWMVGIVLVSLVAAALVLPAPAYADHWDHHRHFRDNRHFGGGFAAGAVTGFVVGNIFAPRVYAAPPVVYQPAPVYVQPAPVYAPPCSAYWVDPRWGPEMGYMPGYWACR